MEITDGCRVCGKESDIGGHYFDEGAVVSLYFCHKHYLSHKHDGDGRFNTKKKAKVKEVEINEDKCLHSHAVITKVDNRYRIKCQKCMEVIGG